MHFLRLISKPRIEGGLHAVIEHAGRVGYYLYIYDVPNGKSYDYLQDTLEIAQRQALRDFGIPISSWEKVNE